MPVLNAKIRTFNTYEGSLELENSYFMACPWSSFLKPAERDKPSRRRKIGGERTLFLGRNQQGEHRWARDSCIQSQDPGGPTFLCLPDPFLTSHLTQTP